MAFAGLVAGQSMILGLALNLSPPSGTTRAILHGVLALSAVVVFLLVGLPLLRGAIAALKQGRIVVEQMFLAGIFGAFGASLVSTLTGAGHIYYEVVAILLAIYTFGRLIGDRSRAAAIDAAQSLGREFDTCERLAADGSASQTAVREILAGDMILVPAGAAIAIDGIVIDGVAFVNEAALTGEPYPVVRRAGDTVLAGSHTVDGMLRIRATADGARRRLDGVLASVRAAQARPSHLEKEADRIVAWFLPAVLLVALGTFWFWTVRSGWPAGLFNALAVVLVACPCSMGLATPIGVWSALAALARRGIVASTSDLVERVAGVKMVVFDKTGTLSGEQLEMVDCVCAPGVDRGELLAAVSAIEAASSHPIAQAFRHLAPAGAAQEVQLIPGAGIRGRVNGKEWVIGNDGILADSDRELAQTLRSAIHGTSDAGQMIHVLRAGELVAVILLREMMRDSARETIRSLETAGLACAVLTGDSAESAAIHDLPNVHASLSPVGKAACLASLAAGRKTLFIGDGVNDAPALAEAHVSLSIASGSAIARDVAMGEIRDIGAVPYAIFRCRATVRAIRWNLLISGGYNVIGIVLAAAGVLHPVVAALLMMASSVTASWRALREPRIRFRLPPGGQDGYWRVLFEPDTAKA